MSILSRIRAASRVLFSRPQQSRGFAGAKGGNALADWIAASTSADAELRGDFRKLVNRSRSLERDNDYQRGFLLACQRNINGSHRYDLRSDAGEFVIKSEGGKKKRVWQSDDMANSAIEDAWKEWGKKGICCVDKRTSWRSFRRLAVRSVVRDGNLIARKVVGAAAGNRFGFALQLWEVDHLDIDRHGILPGGGEIRFGIEFNSMGAPVAYWLKVRHPGDTSGAAYGGSVAQRFPAGDFYHLYLPDRAEQTIGYPWIVSAITRLRQLGAFEEAATIAARVGASSGGFFKKTPGPNGEIGSWTGATGNNGAGVMDVEPCSFQELPAGWDVANWNPQYPNIETGDFRKAMLRGVCSSLGVSYTTLGNDLESVNYSSARVGLFDEREGWKELQLFFTEELWELIFTDWLNAAISNGAINLPLAKFARFNRPIFKARRWAAIDPMKEIEAASKGIALRTTSRRQFVEDNGGDIEETFHDNRDDELLAESMDLSLTPPDPFPESFGMPVPDEPETPAKPAKPKPEEDAS